MYTKKVNGVSKLSELLYNLLSKLVYKAQEQLGCVKHKSFFFFFYYGITLGKGNRFCITASSPT